MRDRLLDWDGCVHARDLGGLPTADGGVTRRGAIVRSGSLDGLSESGWRALEAYGIRTIVDLRNHDELGATRWPHTVHAPLDAIEDRDFWDLWSSGPQFGTPFYYGPFLERFPHRIADVVSAIATAPPGGVLYHCIRGRDRTGLVTIVLLALAGVAPEHIADDYELSSEGHGRSEVDAYFESRGTTPRAVIEDLLRDLDVEAYLLDAGVPPEQIARLRGLLRSAEPRG